MTSFVKQPEIPSVLVCPITSELMKDPVITNGGQTYERCAIEKWMKHSNKDPLTRLEITCIIPNVSIRKMCQEYRENTLKGVEIESEEIKEIEKKLKKKITELKEQKDNLKEQQDKLKEQQDKVKEIEKNISEMNNNKPILSSGNGDNWGYQSITLPTRNGSVTITHSSSTIVEQLHNNQTVYRTTTTTSTNTPDANGNINCINCTGCYNCIGCVDCVACNSCTGCTNCNGCIRCTGCEKCEYSAKCTGCVDCVHCENCTGCQMCKNCQDCTSCYHCAKIKKSEHLRNCSWD